MRPKTKIVVTGSGGFLGSYLLKRIEKGDRKVLALMRDTKGRVNSKTVRYIKCDIAKDDLSPYLKNADFVFHLAAIKPEGSDISEEDCTKNIEMAHNLASSNKKAKVIYASTNNVYGTPAKIPITESDPVRPTEHYGMSKLCGEMILDFFSRKRGWPLAVLRIANVYGPEAQRKEGALFNFFSKLKTDSPLEIVGDGSQRRDRVWVEDVTRAFALAMSEDAAGVFNIGSGRSYSTIEVAKMIGKLLHKKPQFVFKKNAAPQKKEILLDIGRAKKILGYHPRTDFKKGLAILIKKWNETR